MLHSNYLWIIITIDGDVKSRMPNKRKCIDLNLITSLREMGLSWTRIFTKPVNKSMYICTVFSRMSFQRRSIRVFRVDDTGLKALVPTPLRVSYTLPHAHFHHLYHRWHAKVTGSDPLRLQKLPKLQQLYYYHGQQGKWYCGCIRLRIRE